MTDSRGSVFENVVAKVGDIGRAWHETSILKHASLHRPIIAKGKSVKELPVLEGPKAKRAIVVSAGPSLHKFDVLRKIKESGFDGLLICVDGSYIKCLKAGLVPDMMVSLDPHPTRMVRWFGDPDFEENSAKDDYFNRQDLDVEFRNNSIRENLKNIELINEKAHLTKCLLCTAAPQNVVSRCLEAQFDLYWWNPLVDDPRGEGSLTRQFYDLNPLPCVNTGGTVGSAAWVFAAKRLNIPEIAVVGMDLGYHMETPLEMTQTYHELQAFLKEGDAFEDLFPRFKFPLDGQEYYTDPTYFWYRKNFLELLSQSQAKTFNCSEAGTLFSEDIECIRLDEFLSRA